MSKSIEESNRKQPQLTFGILIIFAILFFTVLRPYYDFKKIVLFIVIPFLTIIDIKEDIATPIKGNKEFILFPVFVCLTLTTIFYHSYNYKVFIANFNQLLGALLASYIALGLNKNKHYEAFFQISFAISIII